MGSCSRVLGSGESKREAALGRNVMRVRIVLRCVTIAKNNQLLGEAGGASPLVEVLKTHSRSAAVMEQACGALVNIADDGKWGRMRSVSH